MIGKIKKYGIDSWQEIWRHIKKLKLIGKVENIGKMERGRKTEVNRISGEKQEI